MVLCSVHGTDLIFQNETEHTVAIAKILLFSNRPSRSKMALLSDIYPQKIRLHLIE